MLLQAGYTRPLLMTRSETKVFPMAEKTNSGLAKPVNVSPDLALIVGKGPMPRTEVTKKIWEYIKKNDLQDPADKRTIKADEKLKAVLGGKDSVTMFEMTSLVAKGLS
jgi:upstream activation factor subunit UAF30